MAFPQESPSAEEMLETDDDVAGEAEVDSVAVGSAISYLEGEIRRRDFTIEALKRRLVDLEFHIVDLISAALVHQEGHEA